MLEFKKGENIANEDQFKNIFQAVLRGSEKVKQFGQIINNPNLDNDNDPTFINTESILLEVFNDFNCEQVINLSTYDWADYEDLFDELENSGFETEKHESGNTYNWSAPLTNHLNYRVFKNLESNQAFYMLEVHNGFSDVRTGYPLKFGFLVDLGKYREGSFIELLLENESSQAYFNIGDFNFSFDMFNESGMLNVYNDKIGLDDQIYIGDFEDCKKWVKNQAKIKVFEEIFNNKLCTIEVHAFDPSKNIFVIESDDKNKDILEIKTPNCRTLTEVQNYFISNYEKSELEEILNY